ncbi:MAG: acyl-CoA thioesterase [Pseudomonadota bacterium]
MYPFARLALTLAAARRMPPMDLLDVHISQHRVSPLDCDIFVEMNNGRILTLYEFGRFQAAVRIGLWRVLKEKGWGLAVAGASVRYRKRLVPFERYEQRTRLLGWDERFTYIEQGMFKRSGECANHCLFRTAVVANHRSVPMAEVAVALDKDPTSPPLPAWAQNWVEAEATRDWPPMQDTFAT